MQTSINENRVSELFANIPGKRIAVIGDVMLDQYFWGSVSRVSPEAPVPVVEVNSDSVRLGGAANVANNITELGAQSLLIGITGDDANGEILFSLMHDAGFTTDGLIKDPSRPTTIKTRVIAHSQHVVRFDRENTQDVNSQVAQQIINILKANIDNLDGILLQDYNKGVFTKNIINEISHIARNKNKLVTVDPKFNNFFEYRDVTVFKPNRRELEQAFGTPLRSDADYELYGTELLRRLRAEYVLITRGEYGMTLIENNSTVHHVPTRTKTVADVSGAGDTVIATLTTLLAAGGSVHEAASIANFAGGIVCEEIGIVPINRKRLLETMIRFERDNSEEISKASVHNG